MKGFGRIFFALDLGVESCHRKPDRHEKTFLKELLGR